MRRTIVQEEAEALRPEAAPPELRDPALYIDRELSWLAFNERVLAQAQDDSHPLLERVKFLAIAANNLDEFFMVRIDSRPSAARSRATAMLDDIAKFWAETLRHHLDAEHIAIVEAADYTTADRTFLGRYFNVQVCPVLTPLAFDPAHPFPHISNRSKNLAVVVEHRGKTKFARVKVPDLLPRFVPLPAEDGSQRLALLEDVIREHLQRLFPGVRIRAAHLFRVLRDMEVNVAAPHDPSETLLDAVDRGLKAQKHGAVSLLQIEQGMPSRVLDILLENFEAAREVVVRSTERIGLADWLQLLALPRPDLKDRPFRASTLWRKGSPRIFEEIKDEDQILHHPFDSFTSVEAFIDAAIDDPRAVAIKMTLYRIGTNSPLVDRLIKAADRGKQVAVLVELKARFDERSNIDWATRLEAAGVHVVYGVENLKTHCKVCLVVRQEGDEIRRFVHIATGNYNRSTAKLYTDLALFTASPRIVADTSELFDYLTGYSNQTEYRELLVAPVSLRRRFQRLVAREMKHASRGRAARIIIKCNAITDPRAVRLLYKASQAGVTVDLIVRGVCTLRPGLPGISDNITVRSIVGRFLEHSRIWFFENGGEPELFIGSADLMERNLNRRVEVMCPVRDTKLRHHIRHVVLEAYLRDNVRAWMLNPEGQYHRVERNGPPFDAQSALMSKRLRSGTS
jgi:polyphosphate kinase